MTVESVRPAAEGLAVVSLATAGTPLAGAITPGQYVRVFAAGGDSFFAIATGWPTRSERIELLVKRGGRVADRVVASSRHERLLVSGPLGKGFPVERAAGHDVLLVATGSGVGAVRALVQRLLAERVTTGRLRLVVGARRPDGFAFDSEMESLRHQKVEVVRTVSRPGGSAWRGPTGHVQNHLGEFRPDGTVVFLCGQRAMVAQVTELLVSRGLPQERIFLNV